MRGTERSPGLVVLLSILTCGIYLIYWYVQTLSELNGTGHSPTGNSPLMDFLITLVTCGVYRIYVDYRMSKSILELQRERAVPPNDTATLVVLLDIFLLGFVAPGVLQSELNKIWLQSAGDAAGR